MHAGIQISSFAPLMQDPNGLESTFESISRFGCRNVQLQWISKQIPAETVAQLLIRYGLISLGVQDKNAEIFADPGYYTSLNQACGSKEVCVSGIPAEVPFCQYAERFAELKDECGKAGIMLSYHPTRTDFNYGCRACDQLLETFGDVKLCADICQLKDNNVDPVAFLKAHAGRINLVHFKDRGADGELCIVGEGKTDFEPIARVCEDIGVSYILAEQETWKGDAVESLKRGYEYIDSLLRKLGA